MEISADGSSPPRDVQPRDVARMWFLSREGPLETKTGGEAARKNVLS